MSRKGSVSGSNEMFTSTRIEDFKFKIVHSKNLFIRLIPSLIDYSKKIAYKKKKKNQLQILLFPNQQTIHFQISKQMRSDLIQQYKRLKKASHYEFYLSRCNLYIDNHHLNILKRMNSVSTEFGQYGHAISFTQWISQEDPNHLILATDKNFLVIISNGNEPLPYKINLSASNKQIITNHCIFNQFIFIFTDKNSFIVFKFKDLAQRIKKKIPIKENLKLKLTDSKQKQLVKCQAINDGTKFYVFRVLESTLYRADINSSIIGILQGKKAIYQPPEEDAVYIFTNFKIFYNQKQTQKKVIITLLSLKHLIILSHSLENGRTFLLFKFQNPEFPPAKPRFHPLNTIKYFRRKQYLLMAFNFRQKLFFVKIWNDYIQISKRIKFNNRIIKVDEIGNGGIMILLQDLQNQKQKPKYEDEQPNFPGLQIIIMHENKLINFGEHLNQLLIQKYNFHIKLKSDLQAETQPKQKQSKIAHKLQPQSYKYFRLACIVHNRKQILIINHLGKRIERIRLNNWQQDYNHMKKTQNIKLLRYLTLLKNCDSPFILNKPKDFKNLQSFFPINQIYHKQILLQYYFLNNIIPPASIVKLQTEEQQEMMIPFILNHMLKNLSNQTLQKMLNYWIKKDERLVQQIIISGCQVGWQYAISKGWLRALKKMVQMGLDVNAPLAKLSSLFMQEVNQLKHNDNENSLVYSNDKSSKGIQYCESIISYIIFGFSQYFDFDKILQQTERTQDNVNSQYNTLEDYKEQFKQFLNSVLRSQILQNIIRYEPKKAVKIISNMLGSCSKIKIINQYALKDFLQCNKMFDEIQFLQSCAISQIILSHISQTFRLITKSIKKDQIFHEQDDELNLRKLSRIRNEKYAIIQNDEFNDCLKVQHGKLLKMAFLQSFNKRKKMNNFNNAVLKDLGKNILKIEPSELINGVLTKQISTKSDSKTNSESGSPQKYNKKSSMKPKDKQNKQILQKNQIKQSEYFQGKLTQLTFDFKIEYLEEILYCLVKQNNKRIKKIFKTNPEYFLKSTDNVENCTAQEIIQCKMEDFLTDICNVIYERLYQKWRKEDKKLDKYTNKQLKSSNVSYQIQNFNGTERQRQEHLQEIMTNLQLLNNSNHYLIISAMRKLSHHEYKSKILRRFLLSPNKIIKQRVFDWIKRQKVLDENTILQHQFILHLKNLIQINTEAVRIILKSYYKGKEKEIIKKIDNDPILQLEYVQLILKDPVEEVQTYYTSLHLKLLLYYKPQTLIATIQNNKNQFIKYDINQILRLTIQRPNFAQKQKILTFLYEKEGQIQKCISTYLKIFQLKIYDYITAYEKQTNNLIGGGGQSQPQNSQQEEAQEQPIIYNPNDYKNSTKAKLFVVSELLSNKKKSTKSQISTLTTQILQNFTQLAILLFRQPIISQAQIHMILEHVNKLTININKQHHQYKKHYVELISYYLGKFIVQLYQRGFLQQLQKWIKNTKNKILFNYLKFYLIQGYLQLKSKNTILVNTLYIDQKYLISSIKQTVKYMELGVGFKNICTVCQKSMGNLQKNQEQNEELNSLQPPNKLTHKKVHQQGLLFNCGHMYHLSCIQPDNGGDYCWKCAESNNYQTMIDFPSIDLVNVLQKYKNKKSYFLREKLLGQSFRIIFRAFMDIKQETVNVDEKKIKAINYQKQQQEKDDEDHKIPKKWRKKINRLTIFDKKQNSIQEQAQIIDLKIIIDEYYQNLNKQMSRKWK